MDNAISPEAPGGVGRLRRRPVSTVLIEHQMAKE